MASSSRGKAKIGMRRMDAAYDRLIPMGFKKQEIYKTINHLIKDVYGDVDAWRIFEEESYRPVIENLLEPAEEEMQQKVAERGFSESDDEKFKDWRSNVKKIPVMDESELRKVYDSDSEGHLRAPCFGYLSETGSDSESDDGDDDALLK